MADQGEQYEKSWILHHILDRCIGSRELLIIKRRLTVVEDQIAKTRVGSMEQFKTGSDAEGINLDGSDRDVMFIDSNVIVRCPDQDSSIPPDSTDKTVLMMRDADSRPGYVTLELVNIGQRPTIHLMKSVVQVGSVQFISSEIHLRSYADAISDELQLNLELHGPAFALIGEHSSLPFDIDCVHSFRCINWPTEAKEWVSRPRLHGWPDQALRDQIVRDGCHLVPVGDKTSPDTFLQWRISFTTAERKLIYSLTHVQYLVYGLLKYFLKQISDLLKQIIGDADILSSYIIKTIIFHAVENTPESFWQEKYTFFCFMFCLKILITWVNAGYCPNYFIYCNNMFIGKVYGVNQQKLLCILTHLHDMKWECLSFGTIIRPSIGYIFRSVMNGRSWELVLPPPTVSERKCDIKIFSKTFSIMDHRPASLSVSLALLSESQSDMDDFMSYIGTTQILSGKGMETFNEHTAAGGNKEKYRSLRKCKNLISPLASVCASPGLLTLATYHYQTGNYTKSLEMCGHTISSFKMYLGDDTNAKDIKRYEHLYCGRGYTLLHKCQQALVSGIFFTTHASDYWPSQLHHELTKLTEIAPLLVPPLPYAVFLSFLCYHELSDTTRRDTALIQLRVVKYDKEQGVAKYWIVHNLLGICFEMIGDKGRALREYAESLDVRSYTQNRNPAMERIARLHHS